MESPDPTAKKRRKKPNTEGTTPTRKPGRKSQPTNTPPVDTPLDPKIWLLLGVLLIGVGGFFYLDAASAGDVDTRNGGSFIQLIFDVVYSALGRDLAFAVFGGLGALSLIWGIIGWRKNRTASNVKPADESSSDALNE